MKKVFTLLLLFFFSIQSFSQSLPSANTGQSLYWQKSKKQKTAAWILLAGGSLMIVSGYTFFVYEGIVGDGVKSAKAKIAIGTFFAGGGAVIGSIPLFVAAAHNKRIAMAGIAGLKIEHINSTARPSYVKSSFPAVAVQIRL